MFELTTIYCPECGDAAEDMAPENGHDFREMPGYRHVGDRRALCPVLVRLVTVALAARGGRQLNDAVAELTTSEAWLGMLRVSARFTRYSSGRSGLFEVGECWG